MTTIANKLDLVTAMAAGYSPSFYFFWGHRQKQEGVVDKSCLSQWFPARFSVEDVAYSTAEQYMMAEKARLFGDEVTRAQILGASDPSVAKKLGRAVRNFDEACWEAARMAIVIRANEAKFGQNPQMLRFLLGTGDRVLVEASPYDRIWGIGLRDSDPNAMRPAEWPGLNLLGFALMGVRTALRKSPGVEADQA